MARSKTQQPGKPTHGGEHLSLLTRPLGLEGWDSVEPVLLASLASGDPLLLIGPHGSAKSFLLERLAQALHLEYRFYNASLVSYDDLVGIPVPDDDRKSLHYISTPSAIWEAEVVFFDEINRSRHDLQNKLFPIIHERRVQGIPLTKLRYRWAAMNPPPSAEGAEDQLDSYLGAEPLDPALADRFAFIIEVPGWSGLTRDQKLCIFHDQYRGAHTFKVRPEALVATARRLLDASEASPPATLAEYLITLFEALAKSSIHLSTRRATTLHRNILAIQAARVAIARHAEVAAGSAASQAYPDWNTSALLALQNGVPQIAQGRKVDPVQLLAAHRHAWKTSHLGDDDPWRELIGIRDPLERCLAAIRKGPAIDDDRISDLAIEAVSTRPEGPERTTAALALYAVLHRARNLRATAIETLVQEARTALTPGRREVSPGGCARTTYTQARKLARALRAEAGPDRERDRFAANLIESLIPGGFPGTTPKKVVDRFKEIWTQCGNEVEKKGVTS
jgi:MoxR-like ATPase